MYNTSEGLQVLRPYGLHACLQPGKRVVWEETLLNLNLLIFSVTPKGLLLLQHTGAITEGVTYMFSRFTKKLQTRPCVKFGYGVMVTQVAATVPGVVALHSSGFVQAIMVELWSDLECGREDVRVVHPMSSHMDFIDRSCLKLFRTVLP